MNDSSWSVPGGFPEPSERPAWLNDVLEIGEEVGRGGMGVVWRATVRSTGEHVACKVIRLPGTAQVRRLKKEFRIAQGVVHPNLVSLRNLYSDGETAAFTMELVEGVRIAAPLNTAIAGSHRSPGGWALHGPLGQVSAALAVLHSAGLVHRDIKPSNVLLRPDGRVVLLDLGLATQAGQPAAQRGDGLGPTGTPGYLSPQAWRGEPAESTDDLWALGALLYACLTGVEPTRGDPGTQRWLAEGRWFPSPIELCPSAPPDLSELAMELLDPAAGSRPTAETVARRLHAPPAYIAPFWVDRPEQARLDNALRLALLHGGVVLVSGEGGAGKSSLVRRAVGRLGVPGLWGRASPVEHLPYQALDAALDDLGAIVTSDGAGFEVSSATAAMFPALCGGAERGAAPVDAARAFHGLCRLLHQVAGRGGLCLVLDDLQWADTDSQRALSAVLSETLPGLAVVLVTRPEGRPIAAQLCPAAPEVVLGALSPEAVLAGLSAAIGPEAALRARSAVRVDGAIPPTSLPLLASLWLGAGTSQPVSLRGRITSLDPEARIALALCCFCASPMLPQGLSLLGSTEVAARSLISVGLLCIRSDSRGPTVVPVHDLVREAVVETEGPRPDLHRRLGAWLIRCRDDAAAAYHLELGGQPEPAREALLRAGQSALERGAFGWSVDLFERARTLGAAASSMADPLGLALASSGRHEDAVRVWLEGARLSDGPSRLLLLTRAADLQVGGGHLETGLDTLRLLLGEVGERLHMGVGSFFAYAWNICSAAWYERWPGRPAKEARARLDALWTSAITISPMEPVAGRAMQARYRAVAFARGDDHDRLRALAAMLLLVGGEGQKVEHLERRVAVLLPSATAELRGLVHGSRGYGRRLATDFEGAEEELRAALTAFGDQSARHWQHRFCRLALLGNAASEATVPELHERCAEAMASAWGTGDRTAEVSVLLYLSWLVELLRDRPEEALTVARRAPTIWGRPLYMEQRQRLVMAELQCALYSGDHATVHSLVYHPPAFVRLMWRFRLVPFTWAFAGGRLELLRGGPSRRIEGHATTLERLQSSAGRGAALLLRFGLTERLGRPDEDLRIEAMALLRRGRHSLFADALLPDPAALDALARRGCAAPERVFRWARGRASRA